MNRKPVPAHVVATQELRRSNAAGTHPSRKQKARGGRQGARRAAIRDNRGF